MGASSNEPTSARIFSEAEERENQASKLRLIEIVESRQALLLVGAGSSQRLGYVGWQALLACLEQAAVECNESFTPNENKRAEKPLDYAYAIKKHIIKHDGNDNRFFATIHNLYLPKDPPHDGFHLQLVSLPFKAILTTNYDVVLESALSAFYAREYALTGTIHLPPNNSLVIGSDNPRGIDEYFHSLLEDRPRRKIAHLHGIHDRKDSIILTKDDYDRFYGTKDQPGWTMHRKLLWSVFATRRAVFVGYSLTADPLEEVLKIIGQDLWRWNADTHVAIMPITQATAEIDKAKRRKLKDYGIDVYFYIAENNDHSALEDLVSEIASKPSPYPVSVDPKPAPTANAMGDGVEHDLITQFELVSNRFEKVIKNDEA